MARMLPHQSALKKDTISAYYKSKEFDSWFSLNFFASCFFNSLTLSSSFDCEDLIPHFA